MGVLDETTQAWCTTNSPITNWAIGWAFSHKLDPEEPFDTEAWPTPDPTLATVRM